MLVEGLLGALLRDLVKKIVAQSFTKHEQAVVNGMRTKGMTPDKKPLKDCVRDAMFRLIRRVIPSGTVADALRDALDDEVVKRVETKFTETPELEMLVRATREELAAVLKEAVD